MKRPFLSIGFWARTLFLALAFSLLAPFPVRADVAPPESLPGSGVSPGDEVTGVRIVSERVTLTILSTNADSDPSTGGVLPDADAAAFSCLDSFSHRFFVEETESPATSPRDLATSVPFCGGAALLLPLLAGLG